MPLGLLGGIIAGAGAVGKMFTGFKQNAEANKINPEYNEYTVSPYAKQKLGLATQFMNGRMPGAAETERNLLRSQQNTAYNAGASATDSGQLLSSNQLGQAQTDDSLTQLGILEKQNKQEMLQNKNLALDTMTAENDKLYMDMLTKYNLDMAEKSQLRGSAWKNIFGGVSDIASTAIQGDQLGWFGSKAKSSPGYGGE